MSIVTVDEEKYETHFYFKDDAKFKFNNAFVNAIRRVMLSEIKTLAFPPKKENKLSKYIIIDKNTSILNNDIICHRISQIPILLDVKLKPTDIIEINLLVKNVDNDIKIVTTDDCIFFVNNKQTKSRYEYPIEIVRIKKNEELKLTAKAIEGHPKINEAWACVSCAHFYIENDIYHFKFESLGQYTVNEILKKTLMIIIRKLENFKKIIEEEKEKENIIEIEIDNETSTLGNLVIEYIKGDERTEFAAYKVEHPLIDKLKMYIRAKNVKKCIIDNVEMLIKKCNELLP